MKIRACIFDLDGVLTETSHFHFIAWGETARELKVPFDEDDNAQLKGVSRVGSLQYILDKGRIQVDEDTFATLMKEKNDHYLSLISQLSPKDVYAGAKELLLDLRKKDVRVSLGSASKNARMVLDRLELTPLFDFIVDGKDVVKTKPDPEVFLKSSTEFGLDPGDCIVFEDAIKGLQAARAGGFMSVGVGGKDLEEWADWVVPNMTDLNLDLLNKQFSTVRS